MKINHNIAALRTLNELNKVNNKTNDAMMRLSSGLRINSAADDAAGMAISNKMNAQVKGLAQANRNTMDGISMVQTAEGALNETHAILNRMRELAVQASNGTYSEEDRAAMQQEVNELTDEITRIADTTEFNTKPLLQGGADGEAATFTLQIGANKDQALTIEINDMSAEALGLVGDVGDVGFSDSEDVEGGASLNFMNQEDAGSAIETIDQAISAVSNQRSIIGAVQNRLEHTVTNLGVGEENLTAAMSRIQDADMAYEMAQYSQYSVISQAATSMLAQANQRPQQVLQLLQS